MTLNWEQCRGHLAMLGRWREGRECATDNLVSRSQPCCQISFCTGQPPTTKNYVPQNVISVTVEKSWFNPNSLLKCIKFRTTSRPTSFCLNFLEFLLLPLLSSYLLRSLLFWSSWFYIWCLHLFCLPSHFLKDHFQ